MRFPSISSKDWGRRRHHWTHRIHWVHRVHWIHRIHSIHVIIIWWCSWLFHIHFIELGHCFDPLLPMKLTFIYELISLRDYLFLHSLLLRLRLRLQLWMLRILLNPLILLCVTHYYYTKNIYNYKFIIRGINIK